MKNSKHNRWIWDEKQEELVPVEDYDIKEVGQSAYISPDIPDYLSPTSLYDTSKDSTKTRDVGNHKVISGRTQRREDLKRSDCHELDPGSMKHQMKWKDRNHRDPADIMGKSRPYEINSGQADYRRGK
jgi:hypothetical protein